MELLDQAIDSVARIDPDALSDIELHELVTGLRRERDRLMAAEARLVSAWDARGSGPTTGPSRPRSAWRTPVTCRTEPRRPSSSGPASCGRCRPPHRRFVT